MVPRLSLALFVVGAPGLSLCEQAVSAPIGKQFVFGSTMVPIA
jgi:hypothetical protein